MLLGTLLWCMLLEGTLWRGNAATRKVLLSSLGQLGNYQVIRLAKQEREFVGREGVFGFQRNPLHRAK